MKYADDIVKVPEDCVTSEEDYIRRRLAWIRSNSVYGILSSYPTPKDEIVEIMKGNNKV